ncbi:MAG: response regulator [Myxococcota bacterium]
MAKNILIVESDAALSQSIRGKLEGRGFSIEETSDGKGSQELIRQKKPDLVVLAVDLSAGQNGYIICGKLKKDDELKGIPVVIIGNPDGFAKHKALKTRADEYVAKPVDLGILIQRIGGLIGFPEPPADEVDDGFSLSDLVEEESTTSEVYAEEIAVEAEEETVASADPELDMLDAAFDDISTESGGSVEASAEVEPAALHEDAGEVHLSVTEEGDDASSALDGLGEDPAPPPRPVARPSPPASPADSSELRQLKAKVAELSAALDDATAQLSEQSARIRELETDLEGKAAEAEAARSSGGKHDKDYFALKEAANKKDKELLKLKSELNEKEQELLELRERETTFEQQLSESSGELARREAQLKTLTTKTEQLTAERKRFDQQLMAAKEEARSATAKLTTLQADADALQDQVRAAEAELESLRAGRDELEARANLATEEAEERRAELERAQRELEAARNEADESRTQLETTQIDLDSAKNQLTTQATAFAEEAASMRKRVAELEEASQKNEERVAKLYARIKGDEKLREKTKKALSIALQLLDEQPAVEEAGDDEEVAA